MTKILSTLAALSIALAAPGCGPRPAPPAETAQAPAPAEAAPEQIPAPEAAASLADHPLAGTSWRLVEIQSMDDETGTTRPDDPSLYTLRLNADGTANLKLNCNSAHGTWTSEPGEDGASGTFGFGPLAMTRALCPPPSLDERIAAQTEWVRGYLVRDGRLNLSLMADGGILTWEPDEAASGDDAGPADSGEESPTK